PLSGPPPEPGYVLVIDQTRGDASIPGALADAESFKAMLEAARAENPSQRIVVKLHPDVIAGRKHGHFGSSDAAGDVELWPDQTNPWELIEGAHSVYTVSSQMGYEAILAGKPVRCFGAGFYSGWGLTEDEVSTPRRTATHTPETLFHACHLDCPIYFDPWHQRLCSFEDAVDILSVFLDHERQTQDSRSEVFGGVRLWKRRNLARFRPRLDRPPKFADDAPTAKAIAEQQNRRLWLWASHASEDDPTGTGYVEDGFLRSVGLGAKLTQAASLVFDRAGIYYDPSRPSDLERLIESAAKGAADEARAERLIAKIVSLGLSKYNTGLPLELDLPEGRRVILVPGQVEDDASILRGTGEVKTNFALLSAVREANPDAFLIYKPHPDVEAGLRTGKVPESDLEAMADLVVRNAAPAELIEHADEIWTMTSLMGFEALLRGKSVTCLGTPFYAGWGLTEDLGPSSPRRAARPSLAQLAWATLIAYPTYVDPVSGLPCTPELIVERLATGQSFPKATTLSRMQSLFANQSWLWR
ncbi:MAG: capsular polysaccharide biosynthesis protein, partial [Pseudomonadota bacterium]